MLWTRDPVDCYTDRGGRLSCSWGAPVRLKALQAHLGRLLRRLGWFPMAQHVAHLLLGQFRVPSVVQTYK